MLEMSAQTLNRTFPLQPKMNIKFKSYNLEKKLWLIVVFFAEKNYVSLLDFAHKN